MLLKQCLDPLVISDPQGHQFFIAVHQMGDTAQRNVDATGQQSLMHFGHTAMFPKTPLANQSNDIQPKLAMWQCPTAFFFGTLAAMIIGTVRLDALVDHQGQVPLAGQGDQFCCAELF